MHYIDSDFAPTTAHKAGMMGPKGIVWPLALMLLFVLLVACLPRTQITVPSPTATVPNGPTLGPAAGTGSDGSPTAPSATVSSAPQKQVSAVTKDVLNIRAGPGIDYAVKGQLKQGDTITIIGKSADGLWWQYSGGWVSATYVQANGDTSAIPVNTPTP
jgi:uncharacterized protein YgiM (DUF1202 family)